MSLPVVFNILSDVHLELMAGDGFDYPRIIKPNPPAPESIKFCLLPGDIGNPYEPRYEQFLRRVTVDYTWTIVIAGNHEFYVSDGESRHPDEEAGYDQRLQQLQRICRGIPKLTFLEKSSLVLPGLPNHVHITVVGCTLWSQVLAQEEARVLAGITDYRRIYQGDDTRADVAFLRQKHTDSVLWLANNIEAWKESNNNINVTESSSTSTEPTPIRRLVIMTHHLPSFELCHPHYKTSPINSAFASDLHHLIKPPISLWACGHTHYFRRKTINGVPCVINPLGYQDEDTGVQRSMRFSLV